MKQWSLRARLTALLATTLCVYTGVSTVAYLTSSRQEDRLEAGFADELSFLAELPAQRGLLHKIDLDYADYLITRKPDWLARRRSAIADFHATHRRLAARLKHPGEAEEWREIGADFDAYVASQNESVRRAIAGQMSRGEALEKALSKDEVDSLVERMARVGRLGFVRMDNRRRAARSAAFATFGFILLFGIFGALSLSAVVARILVNPLLRMRAQAGAWKLGEPWTLHDDRDAPRELYDLIQTMHAMADKLNAQFENERETNRLKSQLVSGVSHEFNNALTVIHTAHVLLMENDKSPADAPWHEMLDANVSALSAMATNLLNLGRLESGKFNLETQRVDLLPLLSRCLERLEVIARRKKLSVRLDCPADLPAVMGDPDALPLVVANLLTNAFKYTPENGSVVLGAARRPDGRVEVFVRDTGIGIASEDRVKIFTGYYRTEQGKRTAKGFGVGLALSRMILEAHGSELELESEPGKGSRFAFALAAAA
ncbi:MAG: HAMP domain-containing histidine kinase [Elusimicrobia bacterium]|nr:HAMP domain-containing histidine kinase [Elusimicrobiota bacterium]